MIKLPMPTNPILGMLDQYCLPISRRYCFLLGLISAVSRKYKIHDVLSLKVTLQKVSEGILSVYGTSKNMTYQS